MYIKQCVRVSRFLDVRYQEHDLFSSILCIDYKETIEPTSRSNKSILGKEEGDELCHDHASIKTMLYLEPRRREDKMISWLQLTRN